ncbi:MAG: response regulator transcription factor [Bacteroidota bacterium]
MIKVGIVEDNKYMREGWQTFIDYERDLCVVACFGDCESAIESGELQKCDVLLMDIGLPGMSGVEGVYQIKEQLPSMNILMATVYDDDRHIFEALKAGAIGYLTKKISPEDLVEAIREAHNGGSPITPSIARKVINTMFNRSEVYASTELTEREKEILEALATGKSYEEIGRSLEQRLSVDGVRHHVRNIYKKLEVHNRTEAIYKGISHRIISG